MKKIDKNKGDIMFKISRPGEIKQTYEKLAYIFAPIYSKEEMKQLKQEYELACKIEKEILELGKEKNR